MDAKKVQEQRLREALWLDYAMEARMTIFDSNFYGLKHLMPLIETLAYISLECAWPKKKETK